MQPRALSTNWARPIVQCNVTLHALLRRVSPSRDPAGNRDTPQAGPRHDKPLDARHHGRCSTRRVFTIASASEVGLFFQTFVGLLGASVPWIPPALAALALILGLGLRRLEIGTRVTLAVEGISVLLILITAAT